MTPNFKFLLLLLAATLFGFTSCGVYTFRDVSVDYSKYKTLKLNFIENRAPVLNAQLSAALTEAIQNKIVQQTKLTLTNKEDANYIVNGYISNYNITMAGVNEQQAVTNRLNITVHISLHSQVEDKTTEFDVSRSMSFDANSSIDKVQESSAYKQEIIVNVADEVLNKLFSNW